MKIMYAMCANVGALRTFFVRDPSTGHVRTWFYITDKNLIKKKQANESKIYEILAFSQITVIVSVKSTSDYCYYCLGGEINFKK